MNKEIKQDWRKELEHVVKYRLTTDFVTDRQILTELFDSLLSQAVQAEHDRWANQTANAHDNKIREITLQKRDETFLEILEDNKKETMWVGEDAQKIAEESIYNFVEAVKTKLSNSKY